jgi:hypothetical protein
VGSAVTQEVTVATSRPVNVKVAPDPARLARKLERAPPAER